jgi:hypothetical protein
MDLRNTRSRVSRSRRTSGGERAARRPADVPSEVLFDQCTRWMQRPPAPDPSEVRPEDGWRRGVSDLSIGRFGSLGSIDPADIPNSCWQTRYEKGVPVGNGFLCFSAVEKPWITAIIGTGNFRFSEQMVRLARIVVPAGAAVTTASSWVCQVHRYTVRRTPVLTIAQSLLFPGFVYEPTSCELALQFDAPHAPRQVVYRGAQGPVSRPVTAGYRSSADGAMAGPWMMLFYHDARGMLFDMPLQLVFERNPSAVAWDEATQTLRIVFPQAGVKTVILAPFGARLLDRGTTGWWKDGVPRELLDRLDRWAAAALAYPVACEEHYRVDGAAGTVTIRNDFGYVRLSAAWGVQPVELAPLPPIMGLARAEGYPVHVQQPVEDWDTPTLYGPYVVARAKNITYRVPLHRTIDMTTLPMRVLNDERCERLQSGLVELLKKPSNYFSGNMPQNPLRKYHADVPSCNLNMLRGVAWAVWSVPESERPAVWDILAGGMHRFGLDNLHVERELVSGRTFAYGDKIATARSGRQIAFDSDTGWYNGQNLAGLWAWTWYAGIDDEYLRARWDAVRMLAVYFDLFSDWATCTFWDNKAGLFIFPDGAHYGLQGMIGMARMARRLGETEAADRYVYLAAKTFATVYAFWHANRFVETNAVSLLLRGYEPTSPVTAFMEFKGPTFQTFFPGEDVRFTGSFFSYCFPELYTFLEDYCLDQAHALEYTLLPRALGGDARSFVEYGHRLIREWEPEDEGVAAHFYFLDPRLMTRAMLFHESLDTLRSYTDRLTAAVVECFLVGSHPMVRCPTQVRFGGAVWDERTRSLSVTLAAPEPTTCTLEISWPEAPVSVVGPGEIGTHDPGTSRTYVTVRCGTALETITLRW